MTEAEKIVENLINDEPGTPDPKAMVAKVEDREAELERDLQTRGPVNPSTVKQYDYIYHRTAKKADGTACGAKVTRIKTWKRDPNRWEINWKYGMYEYGTVTPHNASEWTTIEPPAVPRQKRRR